MKILHINTHLNGGAAIAVKRIHQGLVDAGINSSIYYKFGSSDDPSYIGREEIGRSTLASRLMTELNLLALIRRKRMQREKAYFLDEKPPGFDMFSPIPLDQKIRFNDLPIRPDILHLHWIAGFFNYQSFFESVPVEVPIVWTLHDMNAFTGGCHYSCGCERYINACGNCPQLSHAGEYDLSRIVIEEKKRLLSSKSIHVVADSNWVESLARQSSVFSDAASIRTIHYGLEVDILTPREKTSCMQALGIPPDSKVVVFGADYVDNKRKGLSELHTAIGLLNQKNKNIFLLTFGKNSKSLINNSEMIRHLGFVSSLDMLSIVYSAADVFVMPSLYEAFGQVALEAMSCGVPVVSFDNGGASDMVIDGVTGFLAEKGDSADLAKKLDVILGNTEFGREMGINARNMVERQFAINHQAMKYKKLYEEVYPHLRSNE